MRRAMTISICGLLILGAGPASAKTLDSVKVTAKPAGIKTKIAAVSNADNDILITISTKKKGKWKVRDRDRAKGVGAGDGKVTIEADAGGDFKNGGEGLLAVGDSFTNYFQWNAKQKRIFFYD